MVMKSNVFEVCMYKPMIYENQHSVSSSVTVPITRSKIPSGKGLSFKHLLSNSVIGERAHMVLHLGEAEVSVTLEKGDRLILGRKDSDTAPFVDVDFNAYFARERGVSRAHAALYLIQNSVSIVDLGSSNGTFLNGKTLAPHQPRVIRDEDEVRLGKLMFKVRFIR
jgi:hypothetical protein